MASSTSRPDWSRFTRTGLKADLYEREPHFREGLADARDVWGTAFDETLHQAALFMVKPEGQVTDGVVRVVRTFLDEQSYEVIAVRNVWLDRLMWREMWRYQLTSATLDRFAVSDEWLVLGPALLLALRATRRHELPASVHLTSLKGSATLADQQPNTLRSRLRQANRMLSLIHVADEPADVLRELAVLLDRPERQEVLRRYLGDEMHPDDKQLLEDATALPKRSLDPVAALGRVEKTVLASGGEMPDVLAAAFAAMRAGGRIRWAGFASAIDTYRPLIDPWDLVVLGTTHIEYDEPGTSKLLVNPDPKSWLS
ncbi:hypothetical protein AB0I77_46550 [Streptomyces sp. NPDC050619]|uniref:hypothetical protein n=1 Tax=Streptomyces sp. NPDC050619 TaxID=3157214 RepID=UPI00343D9859